MGRIIIFELTEIFGLRTDEYTELSKPLNGLMNTCHSRESTLRKHLMQTQGLTHTKDDPFSMLRRDEQYKQTGIHGSYVGDLLRAVPTEFRKICRYTCTILETSNVEELSNTYAGF